MDRLENWARRIYQTVAGGLLLAVVIITLVQVAARYVFNFSLVWSEELNRLLYVWMILVAAIGASHMRIGLIADRLQGSAAWLVRSAVTLIGCSVLGLVVYGGWRLQTMFAFDRYIGLDLSKRYYFLAAVIAGSLWAFVILWQAIRHEPEETREDISS